MSQPSLLDGLERRPRKVRHIRDTSVAAAHQLADYIGHREMDVLHLLQDHGEGYTSGELAELRWKDKKMDGPVNTDYKLYVRRGLSDLQTHGLVKRIPNGDRRCSVTRMKCCTWRITPR